MTTGKLSLETLYGQWAPLQSELVPGYTILMLVPGDLPVFLKIALDVCRRQNSEHLVETLVVPDSWAPDSAEYMQTIIADHAFSPTRVIKFRPVDLILIQRLRHPHVNNWLQFVRGVEAARTTHLLWHDADLFMTEPDLLRTQYERCREQSLACLGVSKVWDTWFEKHGITHLAATWELMFDTSWVRAFAPLEHRGHEQIVAGKPHDVDLTLWPQCQTAPHRIGRVQQEKGFIHFGYVIATYRWFLRSAGPYEDEHFRILLIRLLTMIYGDDGHPHDVPSMETLKKGLTDSSNPVTYLGERTQQNYAGFRHKLQQLIDSGLLSSEQTAILEGGVDPFDRHFSYVSKAEADILREVN